MSYERIIVVSLALAAMGCQVTPEAQWEEPESSLCVEASKHLTTCLGQNSPPSLDCDEDAAAEILERSCEELDGNKKADWFGNWLCDMGFLYKCPAPVCENAVDLTEVESCSELIGAEGCASCDYYTCRDAQRAEPCGDEGYYLGFVGRYCKLFSIETTPRLSVFGQAWIDVVRTCLQDSMEGVSDDETCEEVKRIGYEAHPGCYIDSGFCNLPLSDLIAIANTVAPSDLGGQAVTTALQCVSDWIDPETREVTEDGWEQLNDEMNAFD